MKPSQIPADFLDYFGIETLANSLNLIFPTIPPFDETFAIKFMEGRKFPSLEALGRALSSRPSDIDKFFCVFHYVAHNIRYSKVRGDQSYGAAFRAGEAVCPGYAGLVTDLAGRCGLSGPAPKGFSCLAKGAGWNDLDPPASNHASVLIVYDGLKFL
jgi:hypothetical protein